jgi:hypothetical protein
VCVGSIIGVSGYRQKLLAASRDGAKGGQQGRAHAIIPAHSMQGGALMDCVDGGSDDEEVGTHPVAESTNSRLVEYSFWWGDYLARFNP